MEPPASDEKTAQKRAGAVIRCPKGCEWTGPEPGTLRSLLRAIRLAQRL